VPISPSTLGLEVFRREAFQFSVVEGLLGHDCHDKRILTTTSSVNMVMVCRATNSLRLVIQQKVVGFTSFGRRRAIGHRITRCYFQAYHLILVFGCIYFWDSWSGIVVLHDNACYTSALAWIHYEIRHSPHAPSRGYTHPDSRFRKYSLRLLTTSF
jgi:hypothetical protein